MSDLVAIAEQLADEERARVREQVRAALEKLRELEEQLEEIAIELSD